MSQPSEELSKEFEDFIDTLQNKAMKFARGGAYTRAGEYVVAARALQAWVEEDLDGAMDSQSEDAYERAYRPQ